MPVGQSGQGGFLSRPLVAALGVGLVSAMGCLNLDIPTVPATPPPPSLQILTPKQGDVINLTTQVAVEAASVSGISQVNVLCGPDGGVHGVYAWVAAPYQALVNFAVCQDVAQRNPDGGHPLLQIEVTALSDAGALQAQAVEVFLNTDGPLLSVLYPPTAQPNSPFTVLVASDAGLRSYPQVLLGGLAPTSVTATGPSSYAVFFQATPGLGTDNYPYRPGVPVPIEVLTETERPVRLTVSATALNGNTTEVDLLVDLTRVAWDRYIPGQPASSGPLAWAAQPVATFDGGLVLPLATSAPASSTSSWIPGRLDALDGTFYGFDTSLLPHPDAGIRTNLPPPTIYLASGLNAEGQTLFVASPGNGSLLVLAPPPPVTAQLQPGGTLAGPVTAPLTAVDSLVCLQDSVTGCSDAGDSVSCFNPQLALVTASGVGLTGPPSPGVVAGGGGRYLSPNTLIASCAGSGSWNLADFDAGTVSFGPRLDPNLDGGGYTVQSVSKLLPVGDGTFVVQLTTVGPPTAVVPPQYPILRVGAGSTILGAYTAPLGTPALVKQEVVGVLADGRVVTLANAPPYTNFELWTLNSPTPDVVTSISGLFDSADSQLGSVLAQNSYSGADGSFAVLLSGSSSFAAAIAAFAPNLQPRWLYLYPRIANAGTARLVSSPTAPNVYLVDEANNRAVALQVVPPPPPPPPPPTDGGAACTVDGGVLLAVAEQSLYLCNQPYHAVYRVTNGSCAPVTVTSLGVTDVITAGQCGPSSPGTYPPTTALVPVGQTVTVLDLVAGPFCCASPGCPTPFDCSATNTFTAATSAGLLTASANYMTSLGGCTVLCP